MDTPTLIRAWKDPEFRALLTPEQRLALPENPSGKPLTELDDSELDDVSGGSYGPYTGPLCYHVSVGLCPTTTVLSLRLCTTYGLCRPLPLLE